MLSDPERAFRCSQASLDAADDIAGTASTVRGFLLVEVDGAWGREALLARLLPGPVRAALRTLEARHRVRPLLVRRTGRRLDARAPVNVFVGHSGTEARWLEHARLDGFEGLLDLDLSGVRDGRSAGLASYAEPLLLVCTHGRHDACCAERGRPVWHAMQQADPEHTWQVSHVGGDRFAANVIALPDGLYYGRMEPGDAGRLLAAHREGRLLLDRLRGRTCYPFAVQAAEIHLRRALGLDGAADLALRRQHRDGEVTTAVFAATGREWQVRVRTTVAEPRRLTCSAVAVSRPLHHQLLSVS